MKLLKIIKNIMGMESYKDESGEDAELLQAKVNNARKSVEMAEIELATADEDNKDIWKNRIDLRTRELDKLEKELEDMSAGV